MAIALPALAEGQPTQPELPYKRVCVHIGPVETVLIHGKEWQIRRVIDKRFQGSDMTSHNTNPSVQGLTSAVASDGKTLGDLVDPCDPREDGIS